MNIKHEEIQSNFDSTYLKDFKLIAFDAFKVEVLLLSSRTKDIELKESSESGNCNICNLLDSHQDTFHSILKDKYFLIDHIQSVFHNILLVVDKKHYRRKDIEKVKDMLSLAQLYGDNVVLCDGITFPDGIKRHFNLSLVNKSYFPLIEKVCLGENLNSFYGDTDGEIYLLEELIRSAIVIKSENSEWIFLVYLEIEKLLGRSYSLSKYPYVNCCCYFNKGEYILIIFPRVVHKPTQYYDNSSMRIRIIPGITELMGVFVTTDSMSYENLNNQSIKSVFEQISYSFTHLMDIIKPLKNKLNMGF